MFQIERLFLIIYFIINPIIAYAKDYVLIKGNKVNFRSAPSLKSKVIETLHDGEFTILLEIDNKSNSWYKVQRLSKEIGWVYSKYCYYLDSSKYPEKFYKQILEKVLDRKNILSYDGKKNIFEFNDIEFKINEKDNIILLKYNLLQNPECEQLIEFYEYKNKIEYVLQCFWNENYYIFDDYIYILSPRYYIEVFDRSIKEDYYNHSEYKKSFSVRIRNYKINPYGTYLEFDEKNRILIKHIQEKQSDPMTIERYQFTEGKFIKID